MIGMTARQTSSHLAIFKIRITPCNCFSHTPLGIVQSPGFLNIGRDPGIDEFRLGWFVGFTLR